MDDSGADFSPSHADARDGRRPVRRAPEWWIPLVYATVSIVWILSSDSLVAAIASSIGNAEALSKFKGIGFVIVTALLLHFGIARALRLERLATARAAASEALLHDVLNAIPDPVFVKDIDGRIRFANAAVVEVIDAGGQSLIGQREDELWDDQRFAEQLRLSDQEVIAAGRPTVNELRVTQHGVDRTFLATKAPYYDARGAIIGVVGISHDITARKRAEQSLQEAEERYQHAQRLETAGRLAGGVAHDFNNLLTIILGSTEFLRSDARDGAPAQIDDINAIATAAEKARDLTKKLLAVARRHDGIAVAVDVNALIRSMERVIRHLAGELAVVELQLDEALWPILCDPAQLEQVIINLCTNAYDAMPHGGRLTIRTENVPAAGSTGSLGPAAHAVVGDHVRICIADTGEGMNDEVRAHIFEPFFTTKPAGSGTGLGLATVYGVVRQLGGDVSVSTSPGHGTEFELVIPRTSLVPGLVSPPAGRSEITKIIELGDDDRRGVERVPTVLVVEDNTLVRDVTARALREAGYDVLRATSGPEALLIAGEHHGPIDLLVTDVVMPSMNGLALASALRAAQPGLRVLYVSGYAADVLASHGVRDDEIDLLAKPYSIGVLLERARSVLAAAPVAPVAPSA